jgi:pimeloyl-ACP methyl ester carboxylesterase
VAGCFLHAVRGELGSRPAFLKRFRLRAEGRDPGISEQVAPAQLEALAKWGAPGAGAFDYLRGIAQPTLVINGSNDVLVHTVNSLILQQNLPNAQLILYPEFQSRVAVPISHVVRRRRDAVFGCGSPVSSSEGLRSWLTGR